MPTPGQGPCRHHTSLFTKTAYYLKIIKDFSTEKDSVNKKTASVLALVSAKASVDTDDWTMVIRFKNSLKSVEAHSAQYETEWNCMKNILYLRPREHHKVLKKGELRRARVLFEGIDSDGLKENLVREKKLYSLMWFDSRREGEDANCLHYDFEHGKPFCPGVTIPPTTTKKPVVTVKPTKPVVKTTTAPVKTTTKNPIVTTKGPVVTTKAPEEIDIKKWCADKRPDIYKGKFKITENLFDLK